MITETVNVNRGDTDKYGNANKHPIGTADVVFAWGQGGSSAQYGKNKGKGESTGLTAQVFVTRGTDLKARDRITRDNGETYAVVGHSMWDQVQPQTGHDFGWMVFQVEAVTG